MDISLLKQNKYAQYLSIIKNMEDETSGISREAQMEKWKKETERLRPFMDKYENPYIHINHGEEKKLYMFTPGDRVIIQEKIDGSNAHLIVSESGFECYGMNYHLNRENHLQGFYFWCEDHFKQVPSQYFGMKIYGEWLIPHHCEYQEEYYCNFYVFDIMDGNQYLSQDKVKEFCEQSGFSYVPVFYDGPFISWEATQKYVGKTVMGTGKGEGIVVKNLSKLNKANKLFYIKLVDKEYQETNPSREIIKTLTPEVFKEEDQKTAIAGSIITEARVRKMILKKADIGLLPVTWKTIPSNEVFKAVKKDVIKDCYKEEPDTIKKVGKNFPQYAESLIMTHIKNLQK